MSMMEKIYGTCKTNLIEAGDCPQYVGQMVKVNGMIHKYGIPPHGGLGIGLERLTMKVLNLDNVRNACLFPRDMERVTP